MVQTHQYLIVKRNSVEDLKILDNYQIQLLSEHHQVVILSNDGGVIFQKYLNW